MDILKKLTYFIFLLFIIVIIFFNYTIGSVPITRFGHDVPILLDGGWRVFSGQIPHSDFNSPIGFFQFLILSIAIKISGNTPNSLGLSDSLFFLISTLLCFYLTNKKLPVLYSLIFSMCIGIFSISPNAIGLHYSELTYAGRYNRIGFVMITLLAFNLFSNEPNAIKLNIIKPIISGFILAILFYTKINYFILGISLLILGIILHQSYNIYKIIIATSVIFILFISIYFNINFFNLLENYFHPVLNRINVLNAQLLYNYLLVIYTPFIILILSCTSLIYFIRNKTKGDRFSLNKFFIVSISIILSSLLLSLSSTAPFINFENPLFFLPFILLVNYIFVEAGCINNYLYLINNLSSKKYNLYINGSIFLIFIIVILVSSTPNNIKSFIYAYNNHKPINSMFIYEKFENTNLSGLIITNGGGNDQFEDELPYGKVVFDGIELLKRQNISTNNIIFVANFSNPFNFALSLKPNSPDNLYWSEDNGYIDSDKLFNNVDYILWFKLTDRLIELYKNNKIDTNREMKLRYFDYINNKYDIVDQNKSWFLYKRKISLIKKKEF
jgi:hypothetical protein